jgi:ATP-dependent Clp protease ATP-binding subunit ClpA
VVLVDEVEKADRRVLDMFLEVLDTGRLTDLQRRTTDATGCIFVFTSNIGAEQFVGQPTGFSPTTHRQVETVVRAQIRRHLRPELLDRIDDIVVYRPLTQADVAELTHRHLVTLTADLHGEGYHVHIDPGTELMVAHQAQAIGARALRRHLESTVLRPLLKLPPGGYRADMSTGILVWHSHDTPERTI